jgi:hypothetical protein
MKNRDIVFLLLFISAAYFLYQEVILPSAAYRDVFSYSDYYVANSIIENGFVPSNMTVNVKDYWGKVDIKMKYPFSPLIISILSITTGIEPLLVMNYNLLNTILLGIVAYLISRRFLPKEVAVMSAALFVVFPMFVPMFKIDTIHLDFVLLNLLLYTLVSAISVRKKMLIAVVFSAAVATAFFFYVIYLLILASVLLLDWVLRQRSRKLFAVLVSVGIILAVAASQILLSSNMVCGVVEVLNNLMDIPGFLSQFTTLSTIERSTMVYYGLIYLVFTLPLFIISGISYSMAYIKNRIQPHDRQLFLWVVSSILLGIPMLLGYVWSGHKVFFLLSVSYIILCLKPIASWRRYQILAAFAVLLMVSLWVTHMKNIMPQTKLAAFRADEFTELQTLSNYVDETIVTDLRIGGLLVSHFGFTDVRYPKQRGTMDSIFYSYNGSEIAAGTLTLAPNNSYLMLSDTFFDLGIVAGNLAREPVSTQMIETLDSSTLFRQEYSGDSIVIYQLVGASNASTSEPADVSQLNLDCLNRLKEILWWLP